MRHQSPVTYINWLPDFCCIYHAIYFFLNDLFPNSLFWYIKCIHLRVTIKLSEHSYANKQFQISLNGGTMRTLVSQLYGKGRISGSRIKNCRWILWLYNILQLHSWFKLWFKLSGCFWVICRKSAIGR